MAITKTFHLSFSEFPGSNDYTTPSFDSSGSEILVCFINETPIGDYTITDSAGNTWTKIGDDPQAAMYICTAPTTSTNHTVRFENQFIGIAKVGMIIGFNGLDTTNYYENADIDAISLVEDVDVTTSNGDVILSGFYIREILTVLSYGSGQIEIDEITDGSNQQLNVTQETVSAPTTDTQAITYDSSSAVSLGRLVLLASSGPDTTAPTLVSATVENANKNQIVLTYDENLDETSVPGVFDYSPSGGKTVSNVAVNGPVVTLTVNSDYAFGDTITIGYTKGTNPLQDEAENEVSNLLAEPVTNNIEDPNAPAGADIQIERFEVDVTTNGQTYTLSNDVGDVTKAFVRLIGATDKSSGGPVGNTANSGPNVVGVGVQLTDTDELTFYVNSGTVKVMGEVWRYTGSPGGDYEFIARQRGSLTLPSVATTDLVSLSSAGISNRNKCIPFHNGYVTTESSTSNYEMVVASCYIDDNTNLRFQRGASGVDVDYYYDVVEFTGSAWNVGYGRSTNHDTAAETVTLNTDSRGIGGSTFDVTDWETAMIIEATMQGDSTETGLADCIALVQPTSGSTTQVDFSVTDGDASARNDGDAYIHVLQCDDLIIKRATDTNVGEGNNSYGTPLSMPTGVDSNTDLSELSLEWFVSTSGTGTAHARGRLIAQIVDNSGYEIEHWVHRSGNTVVAYYGVADLSGLISATGTSPLIGATSTSTSTSSIIIGKTSLSASSNCSSTTVAVLETGASVEQISGEVNGVATISAILLAKGIVQGIINTLATLNGVLSARGNLESSVVTDTKVDGELQSKGILSGTITTTDDTSGTLQAKGTLGTGINTYSEVSATISSKVAIQSNIGTGSILNGTLNSSAVLISQIGPFTTLIGSLTAKGELTGQTDTVTTLLGTLKNDALIGNTNTSTELTGTLNGSGNLAGVIEPQVYQIDEYFPVNLAGPTGTWEAGRISTSEEIRMESRLVYPNGLPLSRAWFTSYHREHTVPGALAGTVQAHIYSVGANGAPDQLLESSNILIVDENYGITGPYSQTPSFALNFSNTIYSQTVFIVAEFIITENENGSWGWNYAYDYPGAPNYDPNQAGHWYYRDIDGDWVFQNTLMPIFRVQWEQQGLLYVEGTLTAKGSLNGSITTQSDCNGFLSSNDLLGSINTSSEISGALIGRTSLSADINTLTSLSGNLSANAPFNGSIDTNSTLTGILSAKGTLQSSINTYSDLTGTIKNDALIGICNTSSELTGTLNAKGNLVGVIQPLQGISESYRTLYSTGGCKTWDAGQTTDDPDMVTKIARKVEPNGLPLTFAMWSTDYRITSVTGDLEGTLQAHIYTVGNDDFPDQLLESSNIITIDENYPVTSLFDLDDDNPKLYFSNTIYSETVFIVFEFLITVNENASWKTCYVYDAPGFPNYSWGGTQMYSVTEGWTFEDNVMPSYRIDWIQEGFVFTEGTLIGKLYLNSTINGSSTVTGQLQGVTDLSATIDTQTQILGLLTGKGSLAGSISASSTTDGFLSSSSHVNGTVQGSSSTSATLTAIGHLTGTIDNGTILTGVMNIVYINGTINGSTEVVGTLTEHGVQGQASGSSTLTGILTPTEPLGVGCIVYDVKYILNIPYVAYPDRVIHKVVNIRTIPTVKYHNRPLNKVRYLQKEFTVNYQCQRKPNKNHRT